MLFAMIIKSEEISNLKLSSYEGLHFLVGFMENESNIAEPGKDLKQKIFVSSNHNATLAVRFGTLNPVTFRVTPNEVLTIEVPSGYENFFSEIPQRNLVEITSDLPIAVYAFSSIPRSSDSYAVIPISNWGNEYVAVSLPNDQYNLKTLDSIKDFTARSSQIMIMAAYDNTTVSLIPSSLTRQVKQVGQTYEITLNKGQSYLVQSWQYPRGTGDMTGTIVRADKPVGMLSGHVRSALLQGFVQQPPDSKDHLIEMLMPTSAWGNTFITVPFGTNPNFGDYFKVVTQGDDVALEILTENRKDEVRFGKNNPYIYQGLNQPALWRASAPMQVAQFMYRTGDTTESFFYDPSMLVLPPVEQFVSRIMFNTPDESFNSNDDIKFTDHYVTVVADAEAVPNIKIDNQLITAISDIELQKIPGTNFYWARLNISSGKHEIIATQGRFAGILFGVGRFDSYAMTLGCSLNNPFSDDDIPPTITVLEECGHLTGSITDVINDDSYGIYYAWVRTDSTYNYKWKIDPVQPDATTITFNAEPIDKFKDGKFYIDFIDKSGNQGKYVFNYNAINIEYPKEIVFNNIDYNDSICFEFKVINRGNQALDFNDIKITPDSRVKLYTEVTLPKALKPQEEALYRLCIDPKGNSSSIYGKINISFGCDTDFEIVYRGELIALELDAAGVDFGEVQIGDTVCSAVSVKNNGNSDVLLTGLEFSESFAIDTLDIFPYLLKSGEVLYIQVCFSPESRFEYFDTITFLNEYNINTDANISGLGVAPDVRSLAYDFGKVRVGATKTLNQQLINSGNQNALISFLEFAQKSHADDAISNILSSIADYPIDKSLEVDLELSFVPTDTNNYDIVANYNTNWILHPDLVISVSGKGTIPVIETRDVNFGTTTIYENIEITPDLIFNKGNEILSIDKIFVSEGDVQSFGIDLEKLENFTINENDSYSFAILFNPNRIGFHELTLGVIHDALPNFQKDTAYIKIVGTSVAPDSYAVDMELIIPDIIACNFTDGSILIRNLGEKALLTDLLLDKSNNNFEIELLNFAPVYIEKNESKEFSVRIYAEDGKFGKVNAIAVFFEIDSVQKEFEIIPVSKSIVVDNLEKVFYSAGDTAFVKISGRFPYQIDTLTSFKLSLDINSEHLLLLNENISLNLNNFSENLKYNLNISKTKDKLEFFLSPNSINIINNTQWSVNLEFLGLLSGKINGNWNISVSDGKCYQIGEGMLETVLDSVCMYDSRQVIMDFARAQVNIYPNPADEILRLKAIMPKIVNDAKIVISNSLGVNFTLDENAVIGEGISYLEYDISNFPNGTYILKFDTEILKKNILFVIIR